MSDPKPSKPTRQEERDAQRERNHPPRFELHFHVPRHPHMNRAGWAALVTECTGIILLRMAAYGLERVEIWGDGIKVFVVVPDDPNIKLRFFDGEQEEIQRQILVQCERRIKEVRDAQGELDRLMAFVVDHIDQPYGSLGTNAELIDSVIVLLTNCELSRRVLARWDDFDSQVRALQTLVREIAAQAQLSNKGTRARLLIDLAAEIDRVRVGIGGQP